MSCITLQCAITHRDVKAQWTYCLLYRQKCNCQLLCQNVKVYVKILLCCEALLLFFVLHDNKFRGFIFVIGQIIKIKFMFEILHFVLCI